MNGYAEVKVAAADAAKIHAVLKAAGVDVLDPKKLHVTLMYDRKNPDIDPGKSDAKYTAKVTGVERMGEKGSKWEAVTLNLECPELTGRHVVLRSKGFDYDYPVYKPHMSIAYGAAVKDLGKVKALMAEGKLPSVIHLEHETWEPVDES